MSMAYLHWYGTNTFQAIYKYIMTTIVPARRIWSLRIMSFPRYRGNEPGYDVCMCGKICAATSLLPITSTRKWGLQKNYSLWMIGRFYRYLESITASVEQLALEPQRWKNCLTCAYQRLFQRRHISAPKILASPMSCLAHPDNRDSTLRRYGQSVKARIEL